MRKTILMIACLIAVVSLISKEMQSNKACNKRHELQNTRWVSKIEFSYSNYYDFKEHGSYVYYSGERDEYCPGIYSIKEDTLLLHEFYSDEDDPFEILDREVKFIGLIKADSLQLFYREDLIRTKEGEVRWFRTKLEKHIFVKTKESLAL